MQKTKCTWSSRHGVSRNWSAVIQATGNKTMPPHERHHPLGCNLGSCTQGVLFSDQVRATAAQPRHLPGTMKIDHKPLSVVEVQTQPLGSSQPLPSPQPAVLASMLPAGRRATLCCQPCLCCHTTCCGLQALLKYIPKKCSQQVPELGGEAERAPHMLRSSLH